MRYLLMIGLLLPAVSYADDHAVNITTGVNW
jgi:hypothetical protein